MKKIFLIVSVVAIVAAGGIGSSKENKNSIQIFGDGFRYRLKAPSPIFTYNENSPTIKIESFGLTVAEGYPQLPVKIFKAAIPEKATISLRILDSQVIEFPNIKIAPAPRIILTRRPEDISEKKRFTEESDASDEASSEEFETSYKENEEVYNSLSPYPRSCVRLGKTGFIRHQKYIEIIFHPIIYYPAELRALFFSEVEIEVTFQYLGDIPIDTSLSYTEESTFEKIYSRSFINYEQGKSFRVEAKEELILDDFNQDSFRSSRSSSIYKINISRDGIYRIDYDDIDGTANDLLGEDPRTYKLMNRGVEVPIYVEDEADGTFDDGTADGTADYIEFYGQALTDEPKTLINYDFTGPFPDIYQDNDFTDTNVYFLSAEGPPEERERMPIVDGFPDGTLNPPTDFLDTAHVETNDVFLSLGDNEPWFWGPRIKSTDATNYRDIEVALPGLSSEAHTGEINVRIRGTTSYGSVDPDHTTAVMVNGHLDTRDEQDWDGETIFTHIKTFDQSYLTSPTTTVRVEAMTVPGVFLNEILLDCIDINYYRYFQAESDSLSFFYDNGPNQFDITGFTNDNVSIYEITDKVDSSNVVSATKIINPQITGSYTVSFEVSNHPTLPVDEKRHFIVSSNTVSSILTPDSFVLDTDANLDDTANQADIIVIGTPDTIDDSPDGTLDDLLDFRYDNRGLTSKVVMVEDIYDEFNHGLFDPNAIRTFLNYAHYNWQTPPSYVFIIGDGTYDYKNHYGQAGFKNYVPTPIMYQINSVLGYYSSDNWLACYIGDDQLPDIHLGRISTRSISESNDVLAKIKFYEDNPPLMIWESHSIMITDEGKDGDAAETEEFENVKNRQVDTWLQLPHTYEKIYYAKEPYNGDDYEQCRLDILDAIGDDTADCDGTADCGGAVILNYVGHGTFNRWSDENTIFHTNDVDALSNDNRYPWLIASNCLTGGFHHAYVSITSIGEKFVNQPNAGSIASFAPSGLSYTFIGQQVEDLIFDDIYGPHKERETAIITYHVFDMLHTNGSIIDLQGYTYLGDPVLDLAIPKPEPPTRPWDAYGEHQVVHLNWTRSPDDPNPDPDPDVGYNIYRTTNPIGTYTKTNSSIIKDDYYDDNDVTNMTTYYYTITFQDTEGFESSYSNFNTDCDVDGTDCLKATPENPDPPANPTGFDADDPETGWKLDLSWNANIESDLKGYTIYWGTKSRYDPDFTAYDQSKWVGNSTSHTLTGLENNTVYYLCVTATNTSNRESGYSNEDEEKPDYIPGLKPPKAISDLMVTHPSGTNDLELTWTVPTEDIYGDPETIKEINIYRDIVPDFIPSGSNIIPDSPLSPDTTTYIDVGAYISPQDYYYLVQVIDIDDNPSGMGREVPAAIEDLMVEKSQMTPGNIILSWGEITTDVLGHPTIVDKYILYGRDTKFTREDIKNNLVPVIQDNITTTSIEIIPNAGDRYYSVIVVDNRGIESPY